MRSLAVAVAALAALVVTGCVASPPAGDTPAGDTPADSTPAAVAAPAASDAAAEPQSIEDVWEIIGCEEGGLNTLDEPGAEVRQASCRPFGGDSSAYFFEVASPVHVDTYLRSGQLEVGPGDALYQAGPVVILATDAATGQRLAEHFESVG